LLKNLAAHLLTGFPWTIASGPPADFRSQKLSPFEFKDFNNLLQQLIPILSVIIFTALAMIVHELGHLVAARRCNVPASELALGFGLKLCGFRWGPILFNLRILPLGSFLRLDGTALAERTAPQQLLVHLGGIIFNLLVAVAAYGTIFGWVSLLIGLGNLLPFYKHDGWKCGVVIMRSLLRKKSQPAEWVFTFSGCFASLIIINAALHWFHLK